MKSRLLPAIAACSVAGVLGTSAVLAHVGDESTATAGPLPPAALVQLETVREATARFLDVDQAVLEGYVDIGLFYPNMGWHYLKAELLDATFEVDRPELLVYADDPCSGNRRLVAVEYAVPVSLVKNAPQGFTGHGDVWTVNEQFQLWTLHAWLFEYNPAGVFASHNPRLP